jgi:hypothetical protein
MSSSNLKNITIVKENDVITAVDVPSYYKTFMENLGCIPTSTVDVWVFSPMVLTIYYNKCLYQMR